MKKPATVIITHKRKRKKHQHHGGTWKIAYADFMTAMMAFFLVMWLLSSSSDVQREMIADYFRTPLKPALANGNRISYSDSVIPGGGDDFMKKEGEVDRSQLNDGDVNKNLRSLRRAKQRLEQMIETDPRLNNFKSNLLLTLTVDGLVIQITDTQDRPMFERGSETPEHYMKDILHALVPLLNDLPNPVMLTGHTDSVPYAGGMGGYTNWELSAGRANAVRRVLANAGFDDNKFLRIIGAGSRMTLENLTDDDPRNRRITILITSINKQQQIMHEDNSL